MEDKKKRWSRASSLILPCEFSRATLGSSLVCHECSASPPGHPWQCTFPGCDIQWHGTFPGCESPAGRTAPASSSFAELPPLTPVQRCQCCNISVWRDKCSFPLVGMAAQGRCDCNKSPGFVLAHGCVGNSFPTDPHMPECTTVHVHKTSEPGCKARICWKNLAGYID